MLALFPAVQNLGMQLDGVVNQLATDVGGTVYMIQLPFSTLQFCVALLCWLYCHFLLLSELRSEYVHGTVASCTHRYLEGLCHHFENGILGGQELEMFPYHIHGS